MTSFEFGRTSYHKPHVILGLLLITAAVLLLSGCSGQIAFSPDATVNQAVLHNPMPDFQLKSDSIRILQKQPVGQGMLVLVSFQGFQQGSGESICLFTYQVFRQNIGTWVMGGGGGSCDSVQNPDPSPITMGGGSGTSSQPGDPGYSSVSGRVNQADIRSVTVTWEDDTTQTAEVINGTYLLGRTGVMGFKKVEALNEKKEVVFTNEMRAAPEKQQQETERELSEPTKDANP